MIVGTIETKLEEFQEKAAPVVADLIERTRSSAHQAKSYLSSQWDKYSKSADEFVKSRRPDSSAPTELTEPVPTDEVEDDVETTTVSNESLDDASRRAELSELTKAVLYQKAQELDISGRTKMNKDALVSAIMSHEDA